MSLELTVTVSNKQLHRLNTMNCTAHFALQGFWH